MRMRTRRRQIKEGRDFFNEKPPEEYYKPYVYPHPLQEGWEALMKSVAAALPARIRAVLRQRSLPGSRESAQDRATSSS